MIQDDYNAMAKYILDFTEKYNMSFPGWEPERMARLDELLGATLFLCDDKSASAFTGVVLPVDCGFAAYSGV